MSHPSADEDPKRAMVLVVEDNPADAWLVAEALHGGATGVDVLVVQDGAEALSFLRREGRYGESPRPDLVLLDLNLPRKDGRKVLEEVKGDPGLTGIPIVVLTSSDDPQDLDRSFDLQADGFLRK